MDGDGERISSAAIEQAEAIIQRGRSWFAAAGIFPTLEGGIQIEVSNEGDEYAFTIARGGEATGLICYSDDRIKELMTAEEVIAFISADTGASHE